MDLRGDIGRRIRELREGAGITLADLARRLSTHPSNIQRWEQGRVSPNWRSLTRIAEALGVALEDLVSGGREEAQASPAASMREVVSYDAELPAMLSRMMSPRASLSDAAMAAPPEQEAQGGIEQVLHDPRLRALRKALGEIPADLTAQEARQLGGIIRAYLGARRSSE